MAKQKLSDFMFFTDYKSFTNYVKYYIVILLFLLGIYFFYSVESFVSSIDATKLNITKDLPVTRIEIVFAKEYDSEAYINLSELRILDDKNSIVKYWESPNKVYFDRGDNVVIGPIKNLWDENPNTFAHSSQAPDKLTVLLNPGIKLGSIRLRNRRDCCEKRIQKYDMALYSGVNQIGLKSLSDLGQKGKAINYDLNPLDRVKEVSVLNPMFSDYNIGNDIFNDTLTDSSNDTSYDTSYDTSNDTSNETSYDTTYDISYNTKSKKCKKPRKDMIPGGPDGTHCPY